MRFQSYDNIVALLLIIATNTPEKKQRTLSIKQSGGKLDFYRRKCAVGDDVSM
jgi:hypothetical protein